jgi:6-phosphogluconolactonase
MIRIFKAPNELARAVAEVFVARCDESVGERGVFTVALSGGSTPKLLYQLLANPNEPFRDRIPWSKIEFFWSDERHVPPDHPESNFRMTHESLLAHVPVPSENIHRIPSENPDPSDAAAEYERTLIEVTSSRLPQLDLILLGLGTDGHTASLFPDTDALNETTHLVAAPWIEKLKTHRITMTLPLLNNGVSILFLVSGKDKAEIIREVFETKDKYPAQAVKPTHGQLIWMLDQAAANQLT